MENKDYQVAGLLVVGLVAVVAIAALIVGGNLAGAASADWKEKVPGQYVEKCKVSDPKLDPYKVGYVSLGPYRYHDYCTDLGDVVQHYCATGETIGLHKGSCPKGCSYGACLR